ncbi:spore germination protein, partial [Blautia stercoris]|uniref:spore germination protein n=1 Tax=Blautia stercoris TaxID=871664 RepID=UPI0040280B51
VLDSGVIEQLTKENWLSPFPQFQTTERPDKCAMELLNGRVVLLVDNSPVGLLIPAVFNDFLQVSEDEYQTFELATIFRVLRYLAVGCAMLFSGLYLAVTDFHTQVLPTNLILSFAKARRGVPFPGLIETLFMEIAFESVREAGVRAPGPLGGTIGIVGGLIIGQAAVSANLVSPVVVVVVAITALSALAIPNEEFSAPFRLLKFGFIFLGGTLGMFGILLGLYMLLSHIAELKSFGVPYLAPYAGTQRAGYRGKENGIWMLPARFRTRRPLYAKESQKIKLRMKTSDEEERKK